MIKADIHVHTSYSSDCEAPMEGVVKRAIELGLKTLCFTEHMDRDYPRAPQLTEDDPPEFVLDTPAYRSGYEEMREKYGKSINLLFGVELGLQPQVVDWNNSYVNQFSFDYIIGSIHTVDCMDPYYPYYFEGKTEYEAYSRYFEFMLQNLELFSDFDSLGHLDYIVRYGPNKNRDYSYRQYAQFIDSILELIVKKGIALEVNTAGYRKGLGTPNPVKDIILRYIELGGKLITIGSDAHRADSLCDGFSAAEALLLDCGIKEHAVFEKRRPVLYPLG